MHESAYWGLFKNTHPSLILYYPSNLSKYWAPNGETEWISKYSPGDMQDGESYKIMPYRRGNVSGGGKVHAGDAALILRYIVGLEKFTRPLSKLKEK